MNKINIAIIGAGVWGDTHAAIFREHPLAEPVAVCDLNEARARATASKYEIGRVYTSVDQLLEDGGFDAVSIVTPDFLHADIAVKCAEHGVHMLIEKPLATTTEDVVRMIDAIKKHGVRAMVDLHNRWSPPFYQAKAAIEAGELGAIQSGYFRLNDIRWVATDMLSWSARSSILWFLGTHSLDTLRWLFDDEVARVYAVSRRGVLDGLGVPTEDLYQTSIEFKKGGVAQMENGWITPNGNLNINDIKCTVLGDKGMISIDTTHHNMIQQFTDTQAKVPDVLVNNKVHGAVKGFAYESIRSFVDKMATDQPFLVSLDDAANTCHAILAIMESARTRMPVEVQYPR